MIPSSESTQIARKLEAGMKEWVRQGFQPAFEQKHFESAPRWLALQKTGSELWLDTGDIQGISGLWSAEFRGLTTNNTLLNAEVQRGQYDDLVRKTAKRLRELEPEIPESLLVLEIAFVLNAYHGLRLVERFDSWVSVEEHTDLADDVELAVLYGKRFHAICPERFIVKLPLTPAGLLGMRKLRRAGVPVNFTLGFSARHNVLAARLGDPSFVNVFLGRLNAFVSDAGLGSGTGVGEKATAASQEAIRTLRREKRAATRQIAASLRGSEQVWTLAGTDVLTIPLAVAKGYRDAATAPPTSAGPAAADIRPEVEATALRELRFETLWAITPELVAAADALTRADLDSMRPSDLVATLRRHGVHDIFPDYTATEIETIRKDGKIPKLERWRERLRAGTTSLDGLLNISGLHSFAADQEQLDARVRGLLG